MLNLEPTSIDLHRDALWRAVAKQLPLRMSARTWSSLWEESPRPFCKRQFSTS